MARTPTTSTPEQDPADSGNPSDEQVPDQKDAAPINPIARRDVLRMAAGLATAIYVESRSTAVLASGTPSEIAAPARLPESSSTPKTPNIIVLMTDQERHQMHWPPGWAEKNLPSLQRLKRNGLYFKRAYTAVTQCSPSRALMLTSRFAPANRVARTGLWPGLEHADRIANIASLLREKAGYAPVWKGKWHLSYASNAAPGNAGRDWRPIDIKVMAENFGWSGWNPSDAGNAIEMWGKNQFGRYDGLETLGGGYPNNDGRYISGMNPADRGQTPGAGGESTIDFLKNRAPKLVRPFCLFVSLVNPHDIGAYPRGWQRAGYQREAFADLGIELPPNYNDDLSKKPKVQKAARDSYNKFAPLTTRQAEEEYVNFYAYLHTVVDRHITAVLDTPEETGLMDDTIILRPADHGEGGLSHGMREKAYTVYDEMIHIPFIIHNRKLYPEPRETEALYNHLDLLPTILELAGVANSNSYALGQSVVPVMHKPSVQVSTQLPFSFDDNFFLPAGVAGGHLRALVENDWTYAVYFGLDGSGLEYELYDRKTDPGQLNNLLYDPATPELKREWRRLHRSLTKQFIEAGNLPDSFAWPFEPAMLA